MRVVWVEECTFESLSFLAKNFDLEQQLIDPVISQSQTLLEFYIDELLWYVKLHRKHNRYWNHTVQQPDK